MNTSNQRPSLTGKQVIERILHLENVGIGCDASCACRAFFALTMDEAQAAALKEHATQVIFGKLPATDTATRAMFGDTLRPMQVETLDRIMEDSQGETDIKGGEIGAKMALSTLMMSGALAGLFATETSEPAHRHSDDMRGADDDTVPSGERVFA